MIEKAQQALDIILPIPAEKFCQFYYENTEGCNCVLGHIHKALDPSGNYIGDFNGFGLRDLSSNFIKTIHNIESKDVADVNNFNNVNGYTEPIIKDRVVHLLQDMISAGY